MIVKLFIEGTELSLFDDETIEINSSVADITDIEANTTDYSKTFTVPASKRNNRVFKHYYNVDIDNSFDARVKVNGYISLNGLPYKLGKFRLDAVSVENGRPSNYTIQFWGNLLSLKDALGNDYLTDLDLTEFDHDYTSDIVKDGLQSSLFNANIIYNNLVKKQYYFNSNPTDTTENETYVNIAYGDGSGENGIIWNDLRPSLRVIEIIKAIEVKYGFTFSRDFFGRAEFFNLFLWLNPDADSEVGGDTQIIDWNSGDSDHINFSTNIGSYEVSNTSASDDNYYWFLALDLDIPSGYDGVEYTVKTYVDNEVYSENTLIAEEGAIRVSHDRLGVEDAPDNPHTFAVYWEIKAAQEFEYTASINQRNIRSGTTVGTFNTYGNLTTIESKIVISEELPEIKTIDFLKGLFKTYKLIVEPTGYNSLYINTFNDYYAAGNLHDITKYVDFTKYDVNRGELLSEINYLFEDPTTILNIEYENNNDRAYGDEENELFNDEGEPLDGDSLDYSIPFEQIVYERLLDSNTNEVVNVQTGTILNEDLKKVNPKPHIFYNINTGLLDTQVGFIDDLGNKTLLAGQINIPSHTMTLTDALYSTVFKNELNEWNGSVINHTLYTNYHKKYIESIFNIRRRDFIFNAKLPYKILNSLGLNDVLKIKENYYRIDSYTLNLLSGVSTLNLLTSLDTIIGDFSTDVTDIFVDYKAQTQSIYVTNLGLFSYNKIDNGYGVDWVSVTSNLNNVYFTFALNDTGVARAMFVDLINEEATKTIRIYLNQSPSAVTFDSQKVRFDSELITWDNG